MKYILLTSKPCLNTTIDDRGPLPQAVNNCGVSSFAKSDI